MGVANSIPDEGGEMNLIDLKNKFAGTLFALALLFGIGLSTSFTAQAQYPQYDRYRRERDQRRNSDWRNRRGDRFNDGYPDLGGSFDLRQTALNAGANAGIKAGRDDRRKGRAYEFRDENAFQKATKDYSTKLGDLGLYRTYYRQAFANAYADGYAGY
jgi:hypothetical protein